MKPRRPWTFLLPTLLAATAAAQVPVDGPPWWGKADNVTVSLHWDFDSPVTFRQPTFVVAPAWYQPQVTAMTLNGQLQQLPQLAGRTGVLGLVGNGTALNASLDLVVDNDPHLDWIKVFFVQFDAFEGASADIEAQIDKILSDYERVAYGVDVVPLAGGWERVTIQAELYPQPDDEKLTWRFVETAFGTSGIDDLFVSSKCIKYDDSDEALGAPTGFSIDLGAATAGQTCLAAAVTQGPAPLFARTYWVSTLGPAAAQPLQLVRLDPSGALLGATALPAVAALVPNGASDLAVESIVNAAGVTVQQFVYAILDRRGAPAGTVDVLAFDTTGANVPARNVTLAGFPAIGAQRLGLAFDPTGDTGAGTFWVTDQQGNGYEFSRAGALRTTVGNLPLGVSGAGYDDDRGNFYFFSNDPRATPRGPLRVNGYEWSGYTLGATGTEFCGDLLNYPNLGALRGGVASGLEVYRRAANRQFRMVCVVQLQNPQRSELYELHGPYRFGRSLAGRCRMGGGPPFEGSTSFEVQLEGRPDAVFASLYAGFSKTNYGPTVLPFALAPFGFDENHVCVALHLNSALLTPQPGGRFRFHVPFPPPGSGLSYVPMYFQWLVFDPTLPGGLGMSQPAQTVIY